MESDEQNVCNVLRNGVVEKNTHHNYLHVGDIIMV